MAAADRPWLVVRAKLEPGARREFETWRREVHEPSVLKIPGVEGRCRLRLPGEADVALTVYHFRDEEVIPEALSSPQAAYARAQWERWLPQVRDLSVQIFAVLRPSMEHRGEN